MKVWKRQKGLLVRTVICAVSLAAACFFGDPLQALAAPRAQETGERVIIVIDPGHGGEDTGMSSASIEEKEAELRICAKLKIMLEN